MANALDQTTWELVSYRNNEGETVEVLGEHPATFEFQGGRLTGTTGCNRFFASYRTDDHNLTVFPGGSTLMACVPEALAQQENDILAGLSAIAGYEQSEDSLQLVDDAGNAVFTLTAQSPTALTNTEWTLQAYNNGRGAVVTPIIDTEITANFDEDGNVFGSAGCNTYRAGYSLAEDGLTIGPAASTRRLCSQPEGVMEQESAFLALLSDVDSYDLSGNRLTLKNAEGLTLAQFIQ